MDLNYVLSIISDGPAKSFAYKRLQYLKSKFELYSLMNELQELAAMKVSSPFVCWRNSELDISPAP
jgi:AMP deaminase